MKKADPPHGSKQIFKIVLAKAFDLKCTIPEITDVGEPMLMCAIPRPPPLCSEPLLTVSKQLHGRLDGVSAVRSCKQHLQLFFFGVTPHFVSFTYPADFRHFTSIPSLLLAVYTNFCNGRSLVYTAPQRRHGSCSTGRETAEHMIGISDTVAFQSLRIRVLPPCSAPSGKINDEAPQCRSVASARVQCQQPRDSD